MLLMLRFDAPALWTVRAGNGLPLNDRVLPSPFVVVGGGGVVRAFPAVSLGTLRPAAAPAGGFFGVADMNGDVGRQ